MCKYNLLFEHYFFFSAYDFFSSFRALSLSLSLALDDRHRDIATAHSYSVSQQFSFHTSIEIVFKK